MEILCLTSIVLVLNFLNDFLQNDFVNDSPVSKKVQNAIAKGPEISSYDRYSRVSSNLRTMQHPTTSIRTSVGSVCQDLSKTAIIVTDVCTCRTLVCTNITRNSQSIDKSRRCDKDRKVEDRGGKAN